MNSVVNYFMDLATGETRISILLKIPSNKPISIKEDALVP
jgi:hypothetical protein